MVIAENRLVGSLLHAAATEAKGVRLVAGTTISGFVTGADAVAATLADGRQIAARLLVAADGARSTLRAQAGIETTGWSYGQSGIVTTVAVEVPHQGRAVQHFLPQGPFALLPMTNNRVCVTWSEATVEAERVVALDAAAFRGEVERRFGADLGALVSISTPQAWPLRLELARRLTGDRFVLIGDAAHMVHPIAGQGLNLGLRDVAALAECVVEAARLGLDIGAPQTLANYARVRRFDTMASAAGFDALNRIFSSRSTLARSARGAALAMVDRLPALKAMFVAEAAGETGDVPRLLRRRA
jgi:2-octaprenyl-6-methoxyphenol hydroxylase